VRRPDAARLTAPLREMLTPALTVLLLFQVVSGILVAPLFSLFPVYVETQLRLPSTFTSLIRVLFIVFGGVMAVAGAAVVDRLGRKPAYLVAMAGVIASGCLFLTHSTPAMLALGVVSGLLFGLGAVAGNSYLMEAAARSSLGLATAAFFMTGTVGNALGNLAAGRVARLPGGYTLLGWSIAIGQAALVLAAARLLPALPRSEWQRDAPSGGYRELLARSDIRLLLLLRFLPTVYWGSVTLLLPLALSRRTGGPAAAADYTAASLVVAAICQVIAGRLLDRHGARGVVLCAAAAVTVGAVGKALLADHLWGLVLFGLVGSGAAWSLSVTMTTLIQELSTEATKARLLGVMHLVWSAGFVLGTAYTGYLATAPGREGLVLWIAAGCCAAAVLCAVGVTARLPRRSG